VTSQHEAWVATAEEAFDAALDAFARYGVTPHPDLRLVREPSTTPYYEPESMTIGIGMPDPAQISGRLLWIATARVLGVDGVDAAIEECRRQLPLLMAHELAHHLRHHYGAPIENDFLEEQVANTIGVAFVREHPRYRADIPFLRASMARTRDRLRDVTPESVEYLGGFNVDVAEVLLAAGALERNEVDRLRRVAAGLGEPLDRIIEGVVPPAARDAVARARAAQREAEAYFNRRYTSSLFEYALFAADWLAVHLARRDTPRLAQALRTHILTSDWEASRAEETALLLATTARGHSDELAVAAAEGLLELQGAAAVPELVALLDHPAPRRRAGILLALSPHADRRDVHAAAVALARGTPAERAAAAEVLAARGSPEARRLLEELLAGGRDEQAAALRTCSRHDVELDARPFAASEDASLRALAGAALARRVADEGAVELLRRLLADRDDGVRRAVAQAAARNPHPALAAALAGLLSDPSRPVRRAAVDALDALGPDARSALRELSGSLTVRVDAAVELRRHGDPGAEERLGMLIGEIVEAARRLPRGRWEGPSGRLLEEAVDEQRRTLFAHGVRLAAALAREDVLARAAEALTIGDAEARDAAAAVALHALPEDVRARLAPVFSQEGEPDEEAAEPASALIAELTAAVREASSGRGGSMLSTVERLIYLRAVPVFSGIPLEELHALAAEAVSVRYAAGERIFAVGDEGDRFYVVTSGRVDIEREQEGESVALAELGPGQSFGEAALFAGGRRNATARARGDASLLAVERDAFRRLGMREPAVLLEVLRVAHARLEAMNARLGRA
jgi:HEAT repeat protein